MEEEDPCHEEAEELHGGDGGGEVGHEGGGGGQGGGGHGAHGVPQRPRQARRLVAPRPRAGGSLRTSTRTEIEHDLPSWSILIQTRRG